MFDILPFVDAGYADYSRGTGRQGRRSTGPSLEAKTPG
jgi:hypothetical protein